VKYRPPTSSRQSRVKFWPGLLNPQIRVARLANFFAVISPVIVEGRGGPDVIWLHPIPSTPKIPEYVASEPQPTDWTQLACNGCPLAQLVHIELGVEPKLPRLLRIACDECSVLHLIRVDARGCPTIEMYPLFDDGPLLGESGFATVVPDPTPIRSIPPDPRSVRRRATSV
jgi:hypothetical protein